MVTLRSVVAWHEYTKTRWNGVTHLSEPYARETLCGLNKTNKPTVWEAEGDGCEGCAREHIVRTVTSAIEKTKEFTGE
jgi:hypothetical protein